MHFNNDGIGVLRDSGAACKGSTTKIMRNLVQEDFGIPRGTNSAEQHSIAVASNTKLSLLK
jgi:hypothetical protein